MSNNSVKYTGEQHSVLHKEGHISLTANAGSGKTFVFARRFLELILRKNVNLRDIAAITFTDKAAVELYAKISKEVEVTLNNTTDKEEIKKLERIRRQLISANISTIHSFCIEILREYPIEAAVDAAFIASDEFYSSELLDQSVSEVLKDNGKHFALKPHIDNVTRILNGTRNVRSAVKYLFEHRKSAIDLTDLFNKNSDDDILSLFEEKSEADLKILDDYLFQEMLKAFQSVHKQIDAKSKYYGIIDGILSDLTTGKGDRKELVEKLFSTAFTKNDQFVAKYIATDIRDNFNTEKSIILQYKKIHELSENTDKSISLSLISFNRSLLKIFDLVARLYDEKKYMLGILDFEDILIKTRDVLGYEHVRQNIAERFKYIMIDEYQDTNDLQYQIFLPILNQLTTGNLFVVGDEKQSIYMFRNADLEVFERTKKDIHRTSGRENIMKLSASFRMAPAIALFVNNIFRYQFRNPTQLFNETEASDIVCAANLEYEGSVTFLCSNKNTDNHLSEAELISGKILELKDTNPDIRWRDFAILCRKKNHFTEFEIAFRKNKIPYQIVGGTGFYSTQIVYDFYNAITFFIDKENDAALLGLLRSPFFLINDRLIYKISRYKADTFFNKLLLAANDLPELENHVLLIKKFLKKFLSLPPAQALNEFYAQTGYLTRIAAREDSAQDEANIAKLFSLMHDFFSIGLRGYYDFADFLRNSMEKAEDEGQAAATENLDAVNILTIHKSKGLQFDYVFVPHTESIPKFSSLKRNSILIDNKYGLLAKVPKGADYFSNFETPSYAKLAEYIIVRKEIAENKRLLYVALTRAAKQLYVSYSQSANKMRPGNNFITLITDTINYDPNTDSVFVSGNLQCLELKDGQYCQSERQMTIKIPIVQNLAFGKILSESNDELPEVKELNIAGISGRPKNEIYTATQYVTFISCPEKFRLQELFGLTDVAEKLRTDTESTGNTTSIVEDYKIRNSFAKLKGNILHSLLENNIETENASDYINTFIENFNKNTFKNLGPDIQQSTLLKEECVATYSGFRKSRIFKRLSLISDFTSEFPFLVHYNDFYLKGRIDRIIFEKDKITVIDFKSDIIHDEEIGERSLKHLRQIEFYILALSVLYPEIKEFQAEIIYLVYPDNSYLETFNKSKIQKISSEIIEFVNQTRNLQFKRNFEHCHHCIFYINNKCISLPNEEMDNSAT